ncbi:MAG: hypothetical protein WAL59_23720 [Roseiarcus sp.]
MSPRIDTEQRTSKYAGSASFVRLARRFDQWSCVQSRLSGFQEAQKTATIHAKFGLHPGIPAHNTIARTRRSRSALEELSGRLYGADLLRYRHRNPLIERNAVLSGQTLRGVLE